MTCPRNAVAQPRIPIANVFFQDRVGDQSLLLFGDKLVPAGASGLLARGMPDRRPQMFQDLTVMLEFARRGTSTGLDFSTRFRPHDLCWKPIPQNVSRNDPTMHLARPLHYA